MPHILIVEDEPAIAKTLRFALKSEGLESQYAAYAHEALSLLTQQPFDLGILDVGLPDMNGFDLLKRIHTQQPLPVIFLTARQEEIDRVLGLELGADDYVTKPFSTREVVARVRALLRRTQTLVQSNPATLLDAPNTSAGKAVGAFRWDEAVCQVHFCGQALVLTRAEYGILSSLLRQPQRVLSRLQLLDNPFNTDSDALERTVDAHIKAVRAKLKLIDAQRDPVQTMRGFGYLLNPDT